MLYELQIYSRFQVIRRLMESTHKGINSLSKYVTQVQHKLKYVTQVLKFMSCVMILYHVSLTFVQGPSNEIKCMISS